MSDKVVWFVFVSTLVELDKWPKPSVDDLMEVHEEIKQHVSRRLSTMPYRSYVANYPSCSWDESYGSFDHLQRLDENITATGKSLYLDLCVNHMWIDRVHIIATESGAYLVNKVLDFIDYHGATLQKGDFDSAWDYFLLNGTHMQIQNPRPKLNKLSDLIKSVTLIAPSLPAPSGIMQICPQWALPSIYDHQKYHHKQGRDYFVVDFPAAYVINLNCEGFDCQKISYSSDLSVNLKTRVDKLMSEIQQPVGIRPHTPMEMPNPASPPTEKASKSLGNGTVGL